MSSPRFSQSHGIVPIITPLAANYNTITAAEESVDMSLYNHATFIFLFSADMAGDSGVLTMSAGLTNGAADAAATFTVRYGSAACLSATADVLSATSASVATVTLTTANCLSKVMVIEVDNEDMNVSGVQYRYLTPAYDDAGTAGIFSCVAILSEPRYEKDVMRTAI